MRAEVRAVLLAVGVAAGVTAGMTGAARAAPAAWPIELNKLEPIPTGTPGAPGCRAYIVMQDPDPAPIEQLRLDLVLFGTDGVIARRIALDLGPMAAGKTAVRLFDMPGLPCTDIGRVLINDVLACRMGASAGGQAADQDHAACLDRLTPTSRALAPLAK